MKVIRIYNLKQATTFIRYGCNPIGIGENDNRKYYVKFIKTKEFDELLKRWQNNEFRNK